MAFDDMYDNALGQNITNTRVPGAMTTIAVHREVIFGSYIRTEVSGNTQGLLITTSLALTGF